MLGQPLSLQYLVGNSLAVWHQLEKIVVQNGLIAMDTEIFASGKELSVHEVFGEGCMV